MESSKSAREFVAKRTFSEFGTERLIALCSAASPNREWGAFQSLFQRMIRSWGDRPIGDHARCPSNVADDGAPFEFSLALSKEAPEVQVYVDPQGEPPGPVSNLRAGRALLEEIAREAGVPLDRLRKIEELFFPDNPRPPFAIWIGASFSPGRDTRLKVYLNPAVRSRDGALETVELAMQRLDLTRAWSAVRSTLQHTRGRRDEPCIVCLDLAVDEDARAKVYFRHYGADAADIAAFARTTGEHEDAQVATFYRVLAEHDGPFLGKPALTQVAFVGRNASRPASTTVTFPIGQHVENDAIARERIRRCLTAFDISAGPYDRALETFATRPLDERAGIHAHVTLRRIKGQPRIGVYFASEAYVVAGLGDGQHIQHSST